MNGCPTYLVPWAGQLGKGPTGGVDCTGWAASRVIGASTCGKVVPSGRTIRLLSNEPIPDKKSPGLNLFQVADVATDHYGVHLDVRAGSRALDWSEYEDLRASGLPMLVQLSYRPIAASHFDAGRGFRGGHAMAETQHATYDSLADGRAPGVWSFDGSLYPRELIKEAAGELVIDPAHGITVGHGKVWCAVGRDTAPDYEVSIHPRKHRQTRRYRDFRIVAGRIATPPARPFRVRATKGIDERCSPPRAFLHPDGEYRFLVEFKGQHVRQTWSAPR